MLVLLVLRGAAKSGLQVSVVWVIGQTALPRLLGIIRMTHALVLVAEEEVALDKLGLRRLGFLEAHEFKTMLDDFRALAQLRRPVGHCGCFPESRIPGGGIESQRGVKTLVGFHSEDSLFADILD